MIYPSQKCIFSAGFEIDRTKMLFFNFLTRIKFKPKGERKENNIYKYLYLYQKYLNITAET